MNIILWMQTVMSGSFWDAFWYFCTKIYSIELMLLIIPITYWVTDRIFARQLMTLLVVQLWALIFLKGTFAIERPAANGLIRMHEVDIEGGFSCPSGHAMGSSTLFTALGLEIRRKWFTWLAVIIPFLVGISRLYLGVHWPTDILLGWGFGAAFAYGMHFLWKPMEKTTRKLHLGFQMLFVLLVPAGMLMAWAAIPFIARVGIEFLYPALGALSGAWVGSLLEERYIKFERKGTLGWQVSKCLVGLLLVFMLRLGFKGVVPPGDWFEYFRYFAIGVFITLGAPWLFTHLPWRPVTPDTRSTFLSK